MHLNAKTHRTMFLIGLPRQVFGLTWWSGEYFWNVLGLQKKLNPENNNAILAWMTGFITPPPWWMACSDPIGGHPVAIKSGNYFSWDESFARKLIFWFKIGTMNFKFFNRYTNCFLSLLNWCSNLHQLSPTCFLRNHQLFKVTNFFRYTFCIFPLRITKHNSPTPNHRLAYFPLRESRPMFISTGSRPVLTVNSVPAHYPKNVNGQKSICNSKVRNVQKMFGSPLCC